MLMSVMATELANEAKDVGVRQSAGLVLKNCLSSKVSMGGVEARAVGPRVWRRGPRVWRRGPRACVHACVRACVRAS